jgi:purine-binding chemotaxis protein CheW
MSAATESTTTPERTARRGGKYLTFALGAEEYGIAILKVREIIGMMQVTSVPRAASHVVGVINLRGQVITVIDLRAKFGMAGVERTDQTCIIVAETMKNGRKISTGIVVDRVLEVAVIPSEKIEDAPVLADFGSENFILGMGKRDQRVAILLDVDRVLDGDAESAEVSGQAA